MQGEPPPCRNMKFDVFVAGRWEQEQQLRGAGVSGSASDRVNESLTAGVGLSGDGLPLVRG